MADGDTRQTEQKITQLRNIIARLRAPDGCPWDREQTPHSVTKYMLEEAYELAEAIGSDAPQEAAEELGDLLFMLLFIAHMYEEAGMFSLQQALDKAARKMIRRHPHIFGDTQVSTTDDVKANWQAIKAEESKEKGERHSVLGHLPKALPALQKAFRVGERASRVGFDWAAPQDVWKKIQEEERELKEAMETDSQHAVRQEIGDLLFSVANLARLLKVNPEDSLRETVSRFIERFHAMEQMLIAQGADISRTSLDEMDRLWSAVKTREAGDLS